VLNRKIVALDTRSGSQREVYAITGIGGGELAISPDGKTLAFVKNASPGDLILIPTDGSTPRTLVQGAVQVAYALVNWTPDGESILFGKPGVESWRVSVRTGEQSLVAKYPTGGGRVATARISPDGRRLSYMYGAQVPQVWALENLLPGAVSTK